jgi:two-component system, sensor histidine kinase and response regulator
MDVFYFLAYISQFSENILRMDEVLGSSQKFSIPPFFSINVHSLLVTQSLPLIILLFALIALVLYMFFSSVKKNREIKSLKFQNEKLLKQDASKNKFFSIIAHDLKSPFNSLMGLSEMLLLHAESMSSEQVNNYSKMVHQSTSRVYSLVDNLLQWSRTQMGTIDFKPEKIDLNILTSNIVNLLKLSAQEKDIVIAEKLEPALIAKADANIYSAVMRNLLNNAIKFSRVGSTIHISGHLRKDNYIEIEVLDRGVGMSKDQLEKIFRIETGQSTMGTLNERGTGLGLIICKEFVEINKGVITISSKPGEGTSVVFTIPADN